MIKKTKFEYMKNVFKPQFKPPPQKKTTPF